MAYASASDVAAYTPNLLTGASNFSASTLPTDTAVNNWLSAACAIIESRLASLGYGAPSACTGLYFQCAQLSALYGVAQAEKARTNTRLAPGERTRGQVFEADFWSGLDRFLKQDLTRSGLANASDGYVGGVSQADKDSVASNTDRPASRFRRGLFRNTGMGGGYGSNTGPDTVNSGS